MRPDYKGVKYYSPNDWGISVELEEAENIIKSFDSEADITDINVLLELYNVKKLLECGTRLRKWSEDEYNGYKSKAQGITGTLAKFFAKIDNSTFIELYTNVAIEYVDDFWILFVKFKCYEKITPNKFEELLLMKETPLYRFIYHKEIVKTYDDQLTKELRTSEQTCQILVSKFLEKNNTQYYLPLGLKSSEYEAIFQKYIDSDKANPNILNLIMNAQSTGECPISDRLRLNAKHKYNEYWKKHENNVVTTQYGIGVGIADQDELVKYCHEGMNFKYSYSKKWLEENLDYPTIMNNFTYLFEMFDKYFRSTLVSVKSHISAIESAFAIEGIKHYQKGNHFNACEMLSSAQMHMYFDFLKLHDINLEDVFKWFFETYLPEEFNVTGFSMKSSSATDYVEKCRNLASEMDGVLKQYRMYVRDGDIDRELFEMESNHLVIDGMQSLMIDKYAYPNSNEIQYEMYLLFSDQSTLSYIDRTESKYSTLLELLMKEKCNKNDFKNYQIEKLDWLISRGSIIQNEDNTVKLNYSRIFVLKDLYDHDVICVQHMQNLSDVLHEMQTNGDLKIENTLFSKPEKEYLNYVLNKAEYSNGLDLRNKYAHSNYPQNEDKQQQDYIELLKVMVLIITKMNEEFCWIDERKGGVSI